MRCARLAGIGGAAFALTAVAALGAGPAQRAITTPPIVVKDAPANGVVPPPPAPVQHAITTQAIVVADAPRVPAGGPATPGSTQRAITTPPIVVREVP